MKEGWRMGRGRQGQALMETSLAVILIKCVSLGCTVKVNPKRRSAEGVRRLTRPQLDCAGSLHPLQFLEPTKADNNSQAWGWTHKREAGLGYKAQACVKKNKTSSAGFPHGVRKMP